MHKKNTGKSSLVFGAAYKELSEFEVSAIGGGEGFYDKKYIQKRELYEFENTQQPYGGGNLMGIGTEGLWTYKIRNPYYGADQLWTGGFGTAPEQPAMDAGFGIAWGAGG